MTDNTTISQSQTISMLDLYFSGITQLVVILLGLIGNTLTMIVLTRKSMRSSTNTFLFALAISDSIILICTALLISLRPLSDNYKHVIGPHVTPWVYPIALTARTCTIWITVSFTVERYIAVCHPLRAAHMCTIKRARVINTIVFLAAVAYNLPRWFEFVVTADESTNVTSYAYTVTEFGAGMFMTDVYYTGLYLPVMTLLPILLLLVLNTCLILAVRKSTHDYKVKRTVSDVSHRENNITLMLVAVVFVFIISQLPALVYNIAYGVNREYVQSSEPHQMLSHVRNFMVTLNSAVNILLYCAVGKKFRRIFLMTFTCCFYKQDKKIPPDQSSCCNKSASKTRHSVNGKNDIYLRISSQETEISEAEAQL